MVLEDTDLRKQIEAGNIGRVYLLYGDEKYLLKRALSKLIKKAGSDNFPEFNFNEFSSAAGVDEIADAAMNLPFMAERKCVVVYDLPVESLSSSESSKLIELVSDVPDSTVLIFACSTISADPKQAKWKKFITELGKSGYSVEFRRKERSELARFLISEAQKNGSSISRSNAESVVDFAGTDLTLLSNEIKKLSAFAEGREITYEDIDKLVTKNTEAKVYALSKAILASNYTEAYHILDTLFYSKESPQRILSVLAGTYVDMYRVRAALQSGKSCMAPGEYAMYKGRDFILRNAERDLRSLSTDVLRECLVVMLSTDIKTKSSRTSAKILLEELVAKLLIITKGEKQK